MCICILTYIPTILLEIVTAVVARFDFVQTLERWTLIGLARQRSHFAEIRRTSQRQTRQVKQLDGVSGAFTGSSSSVCSYALVRYAYTSCARSAPIITEINIYQ